MRKFHQVTVSGRAIFGRNRKDHFLTIDLFEAPENIEEARTITFSRETMDRAKSALDEKRIKVGRFRLTAYNCESSGDSICINDIVCPEIQTEAFDYPPKAATP